jgi:phospholipase C
VEYIRRQNEIKEGVRPKEAREAPAGLGFRVPMIVASPWSRGGRVCSQVFDHTSVFRFVQTWLNNKSNAGVHETNVSLWRKTITGDLTSVFQPDDGAGRDELPWLKKQPFIEKIYNAKFRPAPAGFKVLSREEIEQINNDPGASPLMARQEPGVKASCALPYQLYADGRPGDDGHSFIIQLEARKEVFGNRSAGSPFNIFQPGKDVRSYAVSAGDTLTDQFPLKEEYYFEVHGPNGFCRQYKGDKKGPLLQIDCEYERRSANAGELTGRVQLRVRNRDTHRSHTLTIKDRAYGSGEIIRDIAAGTTSDILLDTAASHGWYDLSVTVKGFDAFEQCYCGRVETGKDSFTDPLMGGK